MSLPTAIGAFVDCLDHYDRALASNRGIRVQFGTYSDARYFAMRMQQARSLHRDESRRIYPKEDPRWGVSEYDGLQVKNPIADTEDHWWVYIERHDARVLAVEEIETTTASEVRFLAPPTESSHET